MAVLPVTHLNAPCTQDVTLYFQPLQTPMSPHDISNHRSMYGVTSEETWQLHSGTIGYQEFPTN